MGVIQSEHFTKAILMLLEETFEKVEGFYLDKNTSMFETLAGISAEEASVSPEPLSLTRRDTWARPYRQGCRWQDATASARMPMPQNGTTFVTP